MAGRVVAIILLSLGIFVCAGYAVVGFAYKEGPLPASVNIVPVTGTVEGGRIYDNDEHGTVFWFRLDGGQRFYYMDGNLEYRTITQVVQPGASVKIWSWTNQRTSSFAQLEVDGHLILTYDQAARDHRERARQGRIAGGISTAIAACLTAALIIALARTSGRSVARLIRIPQ